MRDLTKQLDDMASLVKHSDREAIGDEQLDSIRSLLRQASYRVGIMDALLYPTSFSYVRDGEVAQVKLATELDMSQLSELLELLGEHA